MTEPPRTPPEPESPRSSGEDGSPRGEAALSRRPEDVASLVRTIQKDAAEREQVRRTPSPRGRQSRWWYFALVFTLGANLYVWIGQPDWVVGAPTGPQTAAEEEGILRFRMYVQGQRVEAYWRENGAFPERLEDTGEPLEGMRYQRTGPDSWELLGEMGQAGLILRSSMSMGEFIGNYQEPLGVDGA